MTDKICITPGACIFAACMLLILPLKWSLSVASAAIFHELFHYCAIKLLRGTVYSITIGAAGITMEIGQMTKVREIICALAGPAGSLLLLLFWKKIPLIAFCAGIQGMFNLLPILPLDGGRALRDLSSLLFSDPCAERISVIAENLCLVLLLVFGGYGSVCLHLGILPVLIPLILWLRVKRNET